MKAVKDKVDPPVVRSLPPLWTRYRVRWTFLTRLCASVPADPDIMQAWINARQPRVKPAGALSIQEVNEEVLASIERGEGEVDRSFSMLVFQRHNGGLVERAATTKAHMKDCAFQLRRIYIGKIQGELTLDNRVKNGIYPDEHTYWIPIMREDGTPVQEADGAYDKAIHVRGPRGEVLNAIKRFEYIEPPSVTEFILKVLGRSVSETDLHHLFEYGGTHGYAGERGDGEGKYSYTIERLDA
ncbi:MAG TPA: hypothetical protein DCP69_04995 [Candidatus Omnitrophica bacterium]|nr:hypothetical protein [Candidatus Omnitrophota bacterium]